MTVRETTACRPNRRRTLMAVPLTLLLACGETSAPPVPGALTPLGGDVAGAVVGSARAVAVRLSDVDGRPMAGVAVAWAITAGGGSVSPTSVVTTSSGEAQATWTLGTVPGGNTLAATVQGLPPATFAATSVPGPPATADRHVEAPSDAPVASLVDPAPAVVVKDGFANPVPDVPVHFVVTIGGGTGGGVRTTDAAGVAIVDDWTLGQVAGSNAMTATVTGLDPVVFTTTGAATAPSALSVIAGQGGAATVGTAVDPAPAVLVSDAYDNPVPGISVTFEVTAGGGTVTDVESTTGPDGVATTSWVLGTVAGPNMVRASATGLEAEITATGEAGPPAGILVHDGDDQLAPPGTTLATPPSVRLVDQYDNPVATRIVQFQIASGGGLVTGESALSDSAGVARVGSWTLGPEVGVQTLTATVPGLAPATFTARAELPTFNLFIEAVHLNQGSQTTHGSIGGVANRPGLLRIVARANEPNTYSPTVRVRLYQNDALIREELLTGPSAGVPMDPDLAALGQTWNVQLAAADVAAGLAVEAVIDPEATIPVATRDDNRFPQGTDPAPLDVQPLHPLRIVFFPIHATVQDRTGSVTDDNVDVFLEATRQWIPSTTVLPTVRPPFTTDLDLASGAAWSTLLSDLQAVRTVEGATDEYYHGIIGDFSGIPYGGLAYLLPSPWSSFRTGLSYDRHPFSTGTIAHEIGHNMGRRHAPCGNPGNVDASYPHPDATLGSPGFDILSGQLRAATTLRDYMSYCRPRWTSDYTYDAILTWRRADPLAQPAALAGDARAHEARSPGVLVWGRIDSNGVTLEPALILDAAPRLPTAPGPVRIRATAADGSEIFAFSFDGVPVADGADAAERHFAWFVPLPSSAIDAMARIEVVGAIGRSARAAARPAAPGTDAARPAVRLRPAPGNRVRVEWDARRYPLAMLRDAATGQVLSLVRNGMALVHVGPLGPADVGVVLSDGVRSTIPERQ